ncbi:MAG: four helix bundle protein [Deltaproteobacteria bacterium]|nr:MAG: four helix bundle protein [Deltaproteobacteria bacterium]
MAKIERFEDIDAWQKGRELTKIIYKLTAQGDIAKDFALKDQLRRASISIMANIAEGFEREGNKEFKQFLAMAKGSVGELKSHLYVALDSSRMSQQDFNQLMGLANETSRLIAGFLRYLKDSDHKGSKFK